MGCTRDLPMHGQRALSVGGRDGRRVCGDGASRTEERRTRDGNRPPVRCAHMDMHTVCAATRLRSVFLRLRKMPCLVARVI